MLGVEGVAEEHLLVKVPAVRSATSSSTSPSGPGRCADDRPHQIMALTTEGLTLAGIRKVLELQR